MENIQAGENYEFKALEYWLNTWENRNKCLVLHLGKESGIMHTFGGNFCGDWRSGDGVIFWDNNDVTSADPDDRFLVKQIIQF